MRLLARCAASLFGGIALAILGTGSARGAEDASGGNKAARPNVVVILADDAGWGDYAANGNQSVRTPHIDSLAAEGVTLDRFFVCPVCSPTRAEFLTGRYHSRMGVHGTSLGAERMSLDETTVAESFQAAGYHTGAFGKWHNGSQWPYHPLARGFDEYIGHTAGHWGVYFDPLLDHNGKLKRAEGYIADYCTDQAIDYIERNAAEPFFCYIPFTTPHSPWAVPEEYWRRFKDKPIAQQATLPKKENIDQTRCALAMIENQDWNVGRVLKTLEEHGVAENTIVVYFSDNGPNSWRWNGGMKGRKGSTDEGGIRSACFIRWPAHLPAGRTVERITAAIDVLPTLAAMAGVRHIGEKPLDGRDLTPLLRGKDSDWKPRKIFSTWAGRTSVRTQQYRFDHRGKLFDMAADPGQTEPINMRKPDVAKRLAKAVRDWRKEMLRDEGRPPRNRRSVDPRPFPVGFPEFPVTRLPARDGEPKGGIERSSRAPNCSYFVNWTSRKDRIVWNIDVETAGRYKVVIDYTCPEADAGSLVEMSLGENRLRGRVEPGWDPPLYSNQDTLPRPPGESQLKEFHPLELGTITLPAGEGELVLRAVEIPGESVMDVRRVRLTLLK